MTAAATGRLKERSAPYGYFEKVDLRRVIDTLNPGPVVLFGTSLGAAVALQEAAGDPRVTAVVAVEVFSDLRTIAVERAPWFLPGSTIDKAFESPKCGVDSRSTRSARSGRRPPSGFLGSS